MQVAGVKKEDIDISLKDGFLRVTGKKEQPQEEKDAVFSVSERLFGEFSRTLSVPEGVTPEAIKAKMENGVLTVRASQRPLCSHSHRLTHLFPLLLTLLPSCADYLPKATAARG